MPTSSNKLKLKALLVSIRSSLWFVPALLVLCSIGLALGLIQADRIFGKSLLEWWPRFFATEVEGARSMLSAIAGSMATITGVAFSIVIVALVLASTQYTSRVLRTFMRDRSTQLVLGVFVGVYIYCLLVLRSLSSNQEEFIPPLAVLGGLVLAVIAVGFFVFFIHHISSSIQASEIAAAITRETLGVIHQSFPEWCTNNENEGISKETEQLDWQPIPAQVMGYIKSVDVEGMGVLAREHDVILKMECGVGDFVAPDLPMLSFCGPESFKETGARSVDQFYTIDTYRSIEQDPSFGIRQLVDISLKALSPGVNDTTTAVTCIQHLSAILVQIAQRKMPPSYHNDEEGQLRVISKEMCFGQFVALSLNQILENASGNTEILIRLLDALRQVASVAVLPERKTTLLQWLETIEEIALRSTKSDFAMAEVEKHTAFARAALSNDVNR